MLQRAMTRALAVLLCFFLESTVAKDRKKKTEEFAGLQLSRHSFTAPIQYNDLLDDWLVSGASIFERERLLVQPSIPERAGFAFNKVPVQTDNFEVIIHFRVNGTKDASKVTLDQSFGFWHVHENIGAWYNETKLIKATTWTEGMKDMGLTLSGFKDTFKGFGVVLSMGDHQKNPKSVVSAIMSENHKLTYGEQVPTPNAKPIDFRNTLNAAQLKIRVQPYQVEGFLKQSPSLSWNECFKIQIPNTKEPIKAGGFIGMTAWSGTPPAGEMPDSISVVEVSVKNMDENIVGEEMKDVTSKIQDAYREMLTDKNRHFTDQKSQTEHLIRLVNMLSEHVGTVKPEEEKMFQQIEGLEGRLSKLDKDCGTLNKELEILLPDGGAASGKTYNQMSEEIWGRILGMRDDVIGLRRILTKDSASHKQKIEEVHKNIVEVKKKHSEAGGPEKLSVMAKQSEVIHQTVRSRGSQMSWMFLVLVASVVGIGVLMWNRMRYYEKKHFI